MSAKIPITLRRNYSIKDVGKSWHLTCDVCSKRWELQKPEKGQSVHGGNILHLLDHAASHPLPEAEEVGESDEEPVVELVGPTSQVVPTPSVSSKIAPYSVPTSKNPNPYKVNRNKGIIRASHFRDKDYTNYGEVDHNNLGYSVVIFAANAKHASLVGTRLIQQFIETKKEVI